MHLESAIKFGILNRFSVSIQCLNVCLCMSEFGSYRVVAKEYMSSLSIT